MTEAKRSGRTNGRRGARYGAVQQIYSSLVNPRAAQELVLSALAEEHLVNADKSYLQALIHGVSEQRENLDTQLQTALDRGLDQLDPMEHAILLVGLYELLHEPSLVARIVINEAIELTKTFGATEAHRYVNGVLDRLARSQRPDEYGGR